MRDILGQILPVTNVVMVLLLVYLVYSIFFEKTGQEYQIEPKQEPSQTNSGIDQNSLDSINPGIILERDIFNTEKVTASQQNTQQDNVTSQVIKPVIRKPLELRLLGTVAGEGKIGCAIIENLKTKVQDLYNTGDIVNGARIEKIERNRIILLNDGVEEVLNLYVAGQESSDSVVLASETPVTKPEGNTPEDIVTITSPTERQVNKSAFLAKIGGIEAILKTVKISTHNTDGQEDGLQISGLEGLSMAKFVGLKNGDIIQTINGQAVTNDRKAFQVLRKARSLTSFDLELTRGTENKTLSFKID
ncbi:MAG: hypothetical protein JXA96_04935 [Sedimentisphaerales bacterium]|nr:hypothetical protein [Sedimentisphaerales bacterium]